MGEHFLQRAEDHAQPRPGHSPLRIPLFDDLQILPIQSSLPTGRWLSPSTIVGNNPIPFNHSFIYTASSIRNRWGWGGRVPASLKCAKDFNMRFGLCFGKAAGDTQTCITVNHRRAPDFAVVRPV